jgi:hypothetical protein
MEFPEIDILNACYEAELRNQEMVPLLASMLGVSPDAVFYTVAIHRGRQHGELPGTPWSYFFHGYECDLKNADDGRFLRIDFGPGGRFDTITAWGVLQLIMTSTSPWLEFPALKELFADKAPPYNQYSGNLHRFGEYWDRLERQGCFETADLSLLQFKARYSRTDVSGIEVVEYPPETSPETSLDCSVAHRKHLSAHARLMVAASRPTAVASS